MRLTRSNALSKHPILLIIIGFRITMVNAACIFTFKTFKMSKRVFLFMNHFNKKNYKGSHEMYNAHSYLGTDKIQTYKKIPVLGESGMF